MKNIKILILWLTLFASLFFSDLNLVVAENIELGDIFQSWHSTIPWGDSSPSSTIKNVAYSFLSTAKYIFSGVLLIIIVYAGARMVTSMWTDEEALSKSKRILWYSAIWLFFIIMPWTIYEALKWNNLSSEGWVWVWSSGGIYSNLFINTDTLISVINNTFVRFLKIVVIWIAIIVTIISWLQIMISRWKDDDMNKAKNRIIWSVIWLIFIWFIDVWQEFVYNWEISDGKDIFETIANLALFLAIPIALFFLTLAGYYYITANWDKEKTKKWKNIIIHTLVWTVILLISVVFLYDLITL
jgi:hypothetical protein